MTNAWLQLVSEHPEVTSWITELELVFPLRFTLICVFHLSVIPNLRGNVLFDPNSWEKSQP